MLYLILLMWTDVTPTSAVGQIPDNTSSLRVTPVVPVTPQCLSSGRQHLQSCDPSSTRGGRKKNPQLTVSQHRAGLHRNVIAMQGPKWTSATSCATLGTST